MHLDSSVGTVTRLQLDSHGIVGQFLTGRRVCLLCRSRVGEGNILRPATVAQQ